jgi:hypothetical protein
MTKETLINDRWITDKNYRYQQLENLIKDYNITRLDLVPFDPDFNNAKSINYLPSIRKRTAGPETAYKVFKAIKQLLEEKQLTQIEPEVLLKRQKLIPSN